MNVDSDSLPAMPRRQKAAAHKAQWAHVVYALYTWYRWA
jgi:hypothetical protein